MLRFLLLGFGRVDLEIVRTIANGIEILGRNLIVLHQRLHDRLGPALRQIEIVFIAADGIG